MIDHATPPAKVGDGVVGAGFAGVAVAFECVAADCAEGAHGAAAAHVDWICGVAEMVDAGVWASLVGSDAVARRGGQTESRCRQSVRVCLKGYHRQAEGKPDQRTDHATKRVPGEPDICVWVPLGNVMVQILGSPIVVALLIQRLPHTSRIASISIAFAIADLLPRPVPALTATAGGEEVVVQLVVSSRVCTVKDSHGCAF